MKRLLMIAFHFPPLAGSSGIQRTLRFVQHLPRYGWEAMVLTVSPRAYGRISADLESEIPQSTLVRRAFALDTARHLSVGGRYVASMARPDRWMSWRFDGVRQGLQMVREFKPQALWSTYPIPTAHVIGAELQRRTQLPWIADFRDPMAQADYPENPLTRDQFRRIEEQTLRSANLSTFTTPSAVKTYARRYPEAAPKIVLLENGYDEESFTQAPSDAATPSARASLNPGAVTLLHSGIVYPSERDPKQLFRALQKLKNDHQLSPDRLRVRFRAAVHDDMLRQLASDHGVQAYIEICPPVPYREALSEMLAADGLLLLQAANCNEQIPAKAYEYLRAGRPILCLSDPAGDTVNMLERNGVTAYARLDDGPGIAALLSNFAKATTSGDLSNYLPRAESVAQASRSKRTESLVAHLNDITRDIR